MRLKNEEILIYNTYFHNTIVIEHIIYCINYVEYV